MTADEFAAIEQARALLLRPAQAAALRARAFPGGMRMLLRVAAGDEAALELAAARTGDTAATLREASVFYVQQVMLDDASDSYRILGVDAEAPVSEIKAHYGLLMRWMHPDRNPDAWDAVFAERVTRAWNDLRNTERRNAFDQARVAPEESKDDDWTGQAVPFRPRPAHAATPPRTAPPARLEPGRPLPMPSIPPRMLAGAALSGLAALVLFVAWPIVENGSAPPRSPAADGASLAGSASPAASAVETSGSSATAAVAASSLPADGAAAPPLERLLTNADPPVSIAAQAARLDAPAVGVFSAAAASQRTGTTAASPILAAEAVTVPRVEVSAQDRPANRAAVGRAIEVATRSNGGSASAAPPIDENAIDRTAPAQVEPAAAALAESTPANAATTPSEPIATAPDIDQASLLIGRFARAYQRGDIDAMSALFAQDAQSQGGGIAQIRAAYDRLFEQTSHRSISIRDIRWRVEDERARATGFFEISQARDKQSKARVSHGTISFDIEQRQDRLLIARLEHTDRGL